MAGWEWDLLLPLVSASAKGRSGLRRMLIGHCARFVFLTGADPPQYTQSLLYHRPYLAQLVSKLDDWVWFWPWSNLRYSAVVFSMHKWSHKDNTISMIYTHVRLQCMWSFSHTLHEGKSGGRSEMLRATRLSILDKF